MTQRWYANAFAVPGRFGDSLRRLDLAQELDPSSHSTLSDEGIISFEAGRKEEGIALLKEVERTDPDFFSPHRYLMRLYLTQRNYPAFLREGEKVAELTNDSAMQDMVASARAGFRRGGEHLLLTNLYSSQKQYYASGKLPGAGVTLAKTCIMLGRKQEALQLLEEAYFRHETAVLWCLMQPDLLVMKDELRYEEILHKINFPSTATDRLAASERR